MSACVIAGGCVYKTWKAGNTVARCVDLWCTICATSTTMPSATIFTAFFSAVLVHPARPALTSRARPARCAPDDRRVYNAPAVHGSSKLAAQDALGPQKKMPSKLSPMALYYSADSTDYAPNACTLGNGVARLPSPYGRIRL